MSKQKNDKPSAEALSIAYAVIAEFPKPAQDELAALVEVIARNWDNNAAAWDELLKLHAQQVREFASERGITFPINITHADFHYLGDLDKHIPPEHAEDWNQRKIRMFRHQTAWSDEHAVTARLGGTNPREWELHFPHRHVVRVVDVVETTDNCRQWADGPAATHRPHLRDRFCSPDRLDLPGLAGHPAGPRPSPPAHSNLEAQITARLPGLPICATALPCCAA